MEGELQQGMLRAREEEMARLTGLQQAWEVNVQKKAEKDKEEQREKARIRYERAEEVRRQKAWEREERLKEEEKRMELELALETKREREKREREVQKKRERNSQERVSARLDKEVEEYCKETGLNLLKQGPSSSEDTRERAAQQQEKSIEQRSDRERNYLKRAWSVYGDVMPETKKKTKQDRDDEIVSQFEQWGKERQEAKHKRPPSGMAEQGQQATKDSSTPAAGADAIRGLLGYLREAKTQIIPPPVPPAATPVPAEPATSARTSTTSKSKSGKASLRSQQPATPPQ